MQARIRRGANLQPAAATINSDSRLVLHGQLGYCGHRKVFCGFAAAGELVRASYADVLDDHGRGYQRRMSREHSLEFKRYIQRPGTTSLPLTFNLREDGEPLWSLSSAKEVGAARLHLDLRRGPVLTQVDGQHRLGFLQGSSIQFAFMTYLGLTEAEEREVFATINGKAKGLSGSLLDLVQAKSLGADLAAVSPALFIALGLNTDPRSPWCGRLDLGGDRTVGNKRIASLRTMHQAAARLVKEAAPRGGVSAEQLLEGAIEFWRAVTLVLPQAWSDGRRHLLAKGIGVYCLMSLAGILMREAGGSFSTDDFAARLSDFVDRVDWSTQGPLEGFGGAKGADMALKMILQVRKDALARVAEHA
jgi:DNA sulfur modification protein DndB